MGADGGRTAWVVAVVATVSLGVTFAVEATGRSGYGMVTFPESLALAASIIVLVRRSPRAWPAMLLAWAASAAGLVRVMDPAPPVATILYFGFWSMWSAGALAAGCYLRVLDAQRAREVEGARREQRLDLARDLHDFVAHDVSAMVVQAQAAQVMAEREPTLVAAALRRIEDAGLHALAAMDRTVRVLRDDAPTTAYRVADIEGLVTRFGAADLILAPGVDERVPPEVAGTAYRVVVESLTNVRRHAEGARDVVVSVACGTWLEVSVTNDGVSGSGRQGGFGLPGLAERVMALGGMFTAGPVGVNGWRVVARFPV